MKQSVKTFALLVAIIAMLLSTMPSLSALAALSPEEDALVADHLTSTVNPNANQEAKNILAYLASLSETEQFVTGTFDMQMNDYIYNEVQKQFGVELGLYSEKYLVVTKDDTPREGLKALDFYDVDKVNDQLEAHYKNGNLLLVQDEVRPLETFAPMAEAEGIEMDKDCTDIIVHWDATNPDRNMALYNASLHYANSFIAALKDLEARGVKGYLLRPFVEFNYKNAYGVSEEGQEAFKNVWRQFADMLEASGLTGYLLTYAPGTYNNTFSRYPGNEYVDVLTVTMYAEKGTDGVLALNAFYNYEWYCRTGKPIGFSEFGCRHAGWQTVRYEPRASWFKILQDCVDNWPRFSWINCWGDGDYALTDYYKGDRQRGNDDGALLVHSPHALNLKDLPNLYEGVYVHPGVAQLYTGADCQGQYVGLEQRVYNRDELSGMGLDLTNMASLRANQGFGLMLYTGADATGDAFGFMGANHKLEGLDLASIQSVQVINLQNIALEKDILASDNNDFAWRANDGMATRWTAEAPTAWIQVDLGKAHSIGRYVVRHAGAAGEAMQYNTADFALQYSVDGENWVTVDTVKGNTDSVTDRQVPLFQARYVRLHITKPNSAAAVDANLISIMEFELYGVERGGDADQVQEETPVDGDTTDDGILDDAELPAEDEADSEDDKKDEDGKKKPQKHVMYVTDPIPWWWWALIAAGVLVVGGGVTVLVIVLRRRKKTSSAE